VATQTLGKAGLQQLNLIVSQGSDNVYGLQLQRTVNNIVVNVDLTGYSAKMQMRSKVGTTPWVTLESPTDITLTSDGLVTITLDHETTEDVAWNEYTQGVWDIELTDPYDVVTRLAYGKVTVVPDVTRDE
jgi:hypothetical protein